MKLGAIAACGNVLASSEAIVGKPPKGDWTVSLGNRLSTQKPITAYV